MNLTFLPPVSKLIKDPLASQFRSFSITRKNEKVTPEMTAALQAFAQSSSPTFPCREPVVKGRTMYGETDPYSEWRRFAIAGIKAKGINWIKRDEKGAPHLVFPDPKTPYDRDPAWHISLDRNYQIILKQSAIKGWGALGLSGAERDYDCHHRLNRFGVALPALIAGSFKDQQGQPLRDSAGKDTGGIFIEHDPDAHSLFDQNNFIFIREDEESVVVMTPYIGDVELSGDPLDDLVRNYTNQFQLLGELKARATFEGRVMRHSSHSGNFFRNPRNGRSFVADFDTCLLAEELPGELLAPQLVRDLSTSMLRMIEDLSLWAYSHDWLSHLCNHPSPFYPFLKGVFKDFADDHTIALAADELRIRYFKFIKNRDALCEIATSYKDAWRCKDTVGMANADGEWAWLHKRFLPDCIVILYLLCRNSRLPDAFRFTEVKADKLYRDLLPGIDELMRKMLGQVGLGKN